LDDKHFEHRFAKQAADVPSPSYKGQPPTNLPLG